MDLATVGTGRSSGLRRLPVW